ncbi:MAG: TIGR03013 family XrtA/PEP-CTERM system glycosyltransferase [Caldimonas sp.]
MIRLFNHHFRVQVLAQVLCDLLLIIAAFLGNYLLHGPEQFAKVPATEGLSLVAALLAVNTASGLYRPASRPSFNRSWARAALALLFALPMSYIAFSLLPGELSGLNEMRWVTMVCVAAIITHRGYAAHVDRQRDATRSRILIFGSGASAQLVARTISAADPHVMIVGYVAGPNETLNLVEAGKTLSGIGSLKEKATELKVDEIVVALAERRGGSMPLRELLDCKIAGVQVSDLATYFEKVLGQIRIDQLHAGWLVFGNGFAQGNVRLTVKRVFDVLSSCVLLALAVPFMLITAMAITLESKGPVFYRQQRVGQHGRLFAVLKFRSMRAGAEKDGVPQWAAVNDSRVTRVGALIRRIRLDEFPQLFNVLRGEMSLVGPRPERPYFVEQLTREIPFYAVRHSVKPGVTGWAQVCYQYGATVQDALEKLQYDLYYVKNHSLFLDIVVLFETIGVVLSGKGAR